MKNVPLNTHLRKFIIAFTVLALASILFCPFLETECCENADAYYEVPNGDNNKSCCRYYWLLLFALGATIGAGIGTRRYFMDKVTCEDSRLDEDAEQMIALGISMLTACFFTCLNRCCSPGSLCLAPYVVMKCFGCDVTPKVGPEVDALPH